MKERASHSDYLMKSDGGGWALTKAATPGLGTDDFGDGNTYLYFGKGYWVTAGPAQHWGIWQSLLRFDISGIPDDHEIDSATLRLYVVTGGTPDTDFTVELHMLDSTYGTVDASDWDAAATETTSVSSSTVATDSDGNSYLDIDLTAAQVALLTVSSDTVDLLLKGSDETTEPTDLERLRCHSYQASTVSLRPYLYVKTKSQREQILDGIVTLVSGISEVSEYSMTVTTASVEYTTLQDLAPAKFPVVYAVPGDESRDPEEGGLGLDVCQWSVMLVGGVYAGTKEEQKHQILALQDDIDRLVNANRQLALSSIGVQYAYLSRWETGELFIIDDHRSVTVGELRVQYVRKHDQT